MNSAIRFFGMAAAAIALAGTLMFAPGPAAAQKKFVMKFSTATPRGDQNVWMARFKAAVEKRSGGRIDVRLYPSSQLGTIPRQIEGMQLGTIEAWIGPPAFVKGVDARYQVIDVPGLFDSWAHAQRAVTHPSFRDSYLSLGVKKGIRGIGIYISNPVSVVSRKRPIRRVEDYKGQKIRVLASDIEIEALKRLGAAAVPMPLLEVLPALQRGALDGVKSGMVIFVPFKYWNITKQVTLSAEAVISVVAFVSERWFSGLPKDLQRIVLEEGRKLDQPMHEFSVKLFSKFKGIWRKNGGELIEFPPAERKKLMAILATVGDDVLGKTPALKATYDRLKTAVAATR